MFGHKVLPLTAAYFKTAALLNARNRAEWLRFPRISVEGTQFGASANGPQAQVVLGRWLRTGGSVSGRSCARAPKKQQLGPQTAEFVDGLDVPQKALIRC